MNKSLKFIHAVVQYSLFLVICAIVSNLLIFRNWKEESDQEFVALCALLLCGDLQLKQDTFQAITNKHEVSFDLYCVILRFATLKTMALM